MRKKALSFLLICALMFSLVACGNTSSTEETGDEQNNTVSTDEEVQEETESAETEESDTPEPEGNSQLVVYFSNTGNTESAAQVISEQTGADLAEIERAEDYGDLQEEAEEEILNGEHPEILVDIEDISQYDTIYVGYPIWFDEAPAMIATFLAENDFAGKTIVPFCTSAGDTIENSLHIFEDLTTDAEILEGLTVEDEADIEPWLESLGFLP